MKIRDSHLYRQSHSTFEEYCQDRWEFTANYARRLIQSSTITENIKTVPIGTIPTSERHLRPLTQLRVSLLDLYERQGWKPLGYKSWRECVTSEFRDKQRYLYYQLEAAKTERNLCTMVQTAEKIPERQLRPLISLKPKEQKEAWDKAVKTAPEGNGCNG